MNDFFKAVPFGFPLPLHNPHAVSVSLPALQDVIDYEEGKARAVAHMQSGYPRFFQNKLVSALVAFVREQHQIPPAKVILPVASLQAKQVLEQQVPEVFDFVCYANAVFLILEANSGILEECRDVIRNTGLLVSSRHAEAALFEAGLIQQVFEEERLPESRAEIAVKTVLSQAYSGVSPDHIVLGNCGMNALFAACESVLELRRPQGKCTVVQLGWLYVDTIEVLCRQGDVVHLQVDVHNKTQLEEWLEAHHHEVALLVTEVLTNPLLECVDLPWLHALCKRYDVVLLADVTLATPMNIWVLPYCDIAIESLTKFACGHADVLMGAIVLNPESPLTVALLQSLERFVVPAFTADVCRLGFEIQSYAARVAKISENTKRLHDYLIKQSFVKKVHSVFDGDSFGNFTRIRKSEQAFPGLLSLVFHQDLANSYDILELAKGPSLGTVFTLAMPYVYLAHYPYLKSEAGLQKLATLGLDPGLLRLSVGMEPAASIIAAFEKLKEKSFVKTK